MGPWWLCFVCVLFFSFLISYDHGTSLRYLCFHVTGLLFALVLASSVECEGQLIRVAAFGVAGMSVASLYGLYQSHVGVKVNLSQVDLRYSSDIPGRVYSFFENPNTLGQLLVMLIPLAVGLIFASRTFWGKLAAVVATGLGAIALVLTYSRGSWLSLAFAALVFVALYRYQLLPLCVLAAAAMVPFLPQSVLTRLISSFNFKDSSISGRFPIYEASAKSILHSPVLGVGLGSELVWSSFAQNRFYTGQFAFVHLHNIFLQLWVECGLFGMLGFAGTAISAFKESARAAARSTSALKPLLIGGAAALAGALINGMTDYIWYYPRALCVFWFLMGILFAGIRLAKQEKA
jgi:O-antigen ligase